MRPRVVRYAPPPGASFPRSAPPSMVLQLPRCAECGAPVRSREEGTCRFCGTVLAWELWDEISAVRIELVEAEVRGFEGAIYAVERSKALAGARLREKRAMRKALPDRPDSSGETNHMSPGAAVLVLATFPLTIWAGASLAGMVGGLAAFFAHAGFAGWLDARGYGQKARAYRAARDRYHAGGKVQLLAAGVLRVEEPAVHGDGAQAREARAVVLHTAKGDQHVALAAPDAKLAPGDVGIARLRGVELEAFEVRDHAPVPVSA